MAFTAGYPWKKCSGGRNVGGYNHIPLGGSNTIAAILVLSIIAAHTNRSTEHRSKHNLFMGFSIILNVVGLLATLSRGALH